MSKKLTHDDYTMGWICPLEVEQVAALEMLDEEHERLPQPPTDHNVYSLGSIASHNIVIAGLHQPGNNPAATVVTQMRMTFPNLRLGLLVGIGGGVPVKTDCGMIRLGDVVVSKPVGKHSGAVQYDHGKAKVGQFERTGALAPPPAVLLNAAQDLAARRARSSKDPLKENIKKIDTSIRGLQKYKYPGAEYDYLYPSDYIHEKPGVSCAECGCDPSKRIQRMTDDNDNEPYIVVHRGTIASGELVVKSAMLRDSLAKEDGVLCFEMEAAGALADFPCIVIRGISDYCDSHKNDQWHGYAAMVAAAYARQLFFHMPVDEVKRYISETAETDIHYVKLRSDNQGRQDILHWLTPVDYGSQQSDYLKMRQPGTGQWLLDSAEYQVWLKTNNQTLFCPGIPGAGKTIISAVVVDDLATRFSSDPTVSIAYIYFNFRQQQKVDDLMASLLKQLAQGQTSLPGSLEALYAQHKTKRTRPSLDEILGGLHTVATMYSRVFIVADALDECQVSDDSRTRFLSELFNLQTQHVVNIFATSRFIPQIIDQFNGSMSLEIRAHDEDVRQYLQGRITQSESKFLKTYCEEIKNEITKVINGMFLLAQLHFDSIKTKKTPKKVKNALETLPTGVTAYSYAYKDAMERIKAQDTDSRELAEHVLSWIIHAKRPLIIAELQHALAVEVCEPEFDKENLPQIEDMVSVCAGLVTVDKDSKIFRLVHYTAQEYFERTWSSWFPNAQTDITKICITYLSFNIFNKGFCSSNEGFYERLRTNVLYDYAARNWGHHAYTASPEANELILSFLQNEAKVSSAHQAMMVNRNNQHMPREMPREVTGLHLAALFGLTNTIQALLEDGHDPDAKDTGGRTPLLYAARSGHEEVVQLLLNGGADINAKGQGPGRDGGNHYYSYYDQTALMYAARNGHTVVVRLLLEKGADINAKGSGDRNGDDDHYGQTALIYAISNGHEAVVQLLLSRGANVNAEEGCHDGDSVYFTEYEGRTALMCAVRNGNEAMVRLLLEYGARVNTGEHGGSNGYGCYDNEHPTYYNRTALMYAARNGHEAIVRLLLEAGADVNAEEDGSRYAAGRNYEDQHPNYNGKTALMYAAINGHEAVVRLLLSSGADINAKEKGHDCYGGGDDAYEYDGRTALIYAASKGHTAVVQLLIESGADVNAEETGGYDFYDYNINDDKGNDYGRTALTYAAMKGREAVVRLLLAKDGVYVHSKDSTGQTPLSYAEKRGHEAVASLLLGKGAEKAQS
ncbi:ankyrin repeat-containing domain protein [Talaromyces proteolyticus]|uniref:Ankyrin repeat-containing domain protein n=1 Tax=Talaromyces proteolyticus TaxID=1131652 RepID=A0AAD4PVE0_9EURO|nr:ankyrin repeat-containing domain protein [Talaromyces proteolyticus]KAH8691253.1 ankyrin repeat-containing domain protein [Talaromyces proteolyticus]